MCSSDLITIYGGAGRDYLDGGGFWTGEYYLEGDAGFREFYAAYAPLQLLESGMGAIIYGDNPDTPSDSHAGNNDYIAGSLRDDFIDTGPGVNTAEGGYGDDIILGGSLSDLLQGHEGNDYLDAGDGPNLLFGGAGSDKMISGNGDDIIYGDSSAGYFFNQAAGYWYLETGTIMMPGTYYSITDASTSESGNDYIESGSGSDSIYAGAGDDYVDGGENDDHIEGEGGNDTLFGGDGNDRIWGDSYEDPDDKKSTINLDAQVVASGGNVTWIKRRRNVGNDGDDYLDGGIGNDELFGGKGNDTYYFGRDYGHDTIIDEGGTADRVILGEGITSKNAIKNFKPNGNDLKLVVDENNTLTIKGYYSSTSSIESIEFSDGTVYDRNYVYTHTGRVAPSTEPPTIVDKIKQLIKFPSTEATNKVGSLVIQSGVTGESVRLEPFDPSDVFGSAPTESFEFSDGIILTYEELMARGFDIEGTNESDAISGTNVDDRITTYAGDDYLEAIGGNDILKGGTGDDTYVISALQEDGFSITIDDASGFDNLIFEREDLGSFRIPNTNFTVSRYIEPIIQKRSYDGNDMLLDVYVRSSNNFVDDAFGQVRIKNYRNEGQIEIIKSPGSTIIDPVAVARNPGRFTGATFIKACGTQGMLALFDPKKSWYGISEIIRIGSPFNDNLTGIGPYDVTIFYGNNGDDTITGNYSRDYIYGGAGNDTMYGRLGYDQYHINPNESNLIFDDGRGEIAFSSDSIYLPAGVSLSDLNLQRIDDDLYINNTRVQRFFERDINQPVNDYPFMIETLAGNGWSVRLPQYLVEIGVFGAMKIGRASCRERV